MDRFAEVSRVIKLISVSIFAEFCVNLVAILGAKDKICKALGFDGQGEDTFPDTSIHNLPPVIGRGLATYDSPYNPLFVGEGENKGQFLVQFNHWTLFSFFPDHG